MQTALSARIAELNEKLRPTKTSFAINAYRFASREMEREKPAGFPILDLVSSQLSHNFRIALAEMATERRTLVLNEALSWRHREAFVELGQAAPQSYPAGLKELFDFCLEPPEHEAAQHGYLRGWERPQATMNKAALWRALSPEMERITGDSGESIAGGERWYRTAYGQWSVKTRLDAGGMGAGMRLAHDIQAARHLDLARQLSMLTLLGFPFGTEWSHVGAGDEERVAASVAMICERFIGALPELLDGVVHDISSTELAELNELSMEESRRRKERWKQFGPPTRRRPGGTGES